MALDRHVFKVCVCVCVCLNMGKNETALKLHVYTAQFSKESKLFPMKCDQSNDHMLKFCSHTHRLTVNFWTLPTIHNLMQDLRVAVARRSQVIANEKTYTFLVTFIEERRAKKSTERSSGYFENCYQFFVSVTKLFISYFVFLLQLSQIIAKVRDLHSSI